MSDDDWDDTPATTASKVTNGASDDWDDDVGSQGVGRGRGGGKSYNSHDNRDDDDGGWGDEGGSSSFGGKRGRGRGGRSRDDGDGGGGRSCHKCGETGHFARECPNNDGGDGGETRSRDCYKCHQPGHMARDCPEAGGGDTNGEPRSRNCFKCKQEGHMARDCPEAGDDNGGGGGGDRGCFKCKKTGHFARDCEEPEPEGGWKRGGDKDGEEGEMPERVTYVPPEALEGEEMFADRKAVYSGSGLNFSKYESIKFEITGKDPFPSMETFEAMNLRPSLLANIRKCGYTKPTPIQKHASPQIMNGRDVMACAQTGSGKTAGFLLPILHYLLNNQADLSTGGGFPVTPECLILAPVRELADQIHKEASLYLNDSVVKPRLAYGGVATMFQKNALRNGCNVLVATPGRLKQFMSQGVVDLSQIKFFILDEADRMLDMGFMDDVKEIVSKMPPKEERISGMFSATFPVEIQRAAAEFLNNYVFVVIGKIGGACDDVEQIFIPLERGEKREKLIDIIHESDPDDKILVFVASKKGTDFLAASLIGKGISATSIHGDRTQQQREQALREFVRSKRKVLIATAVAARGLDIPNVSIVVNYDMPTEIDEYVHKIGRTGRVGNTGKAISFYDEAQDSALASSLVGILKDAHQEVPDFLEAAAGGDIGYGGDNGFSSVDVRQRKDIGVPPVVENGEDEWD